MRHLKSSVLLVLVAAMLVPVQVDAQFGRLRQRVQDRVEERVEQRAEREVNQRVDRAVDAAVDRALDEFTGRLSDAFTNNKTTVDEESGVIRSEAEGDIALVANETSPARTDYLSYVMVTKYEVRGTVGALMGNGQYQRIYLHEGKMLEKSPASGSIMDATSGSMSFLDYDNGTYWTHSLSDFGNMLDSVQRMQADAMESNPGQASAFDPNTDVTLEIRRGGSGVIRGSNSQQHFVIVETGDLGGQVAPGEAPQGRPLNGRIFLVSEVWTTDDFAGRDTYREFGERLAAVLSGALPPSNQAPSLMSGMLADPRVDAAMERAAEELSEMQGLAVETRSFLVSVPEGHEFDLDLVLADEEFDMGQWAASMSSEPVEGYEKKQVTIMSWKTFVSNLTAAPFDPALLEVGDLQQVPSPLERLGTRGGR